MKYIAVFRWQGFERRQEIEKPIPYYHQPVMVSIPAVGDFTGLVTSPMTLKLEFERYDTRMGKDRLFVYYRGYLRS